MRRSSGISSKGLALALALVAAAPAWAQLPGYSSPSRNVLPGVPTARTVAAAPTALGNWSSLATAFTGDLSHVGIALSHQISGAATLQQPATGYKYTEEAYPFVGFLTNTSGWNQGVGSNDGRTAAAFMRLHGIQNGQGDLMLYNGVCAIGSTLAGATSFLANPACGLFGGDVIASAAGSYLNPYEVHLTDNGFDAGAVGLVNNFTRTAITVSDASSSLILDPAGTLATGTITLPPTPSNGRILHISSTQTVTALTLSANSGQSNKCVHTTIAAGTSFRCIYQTSNTTWYPY
jgi:hypothetical protein